MRTLPVVGDILKHDISYGKLIIIVRICFVVFDERYDFDLPVA